MEVVIQESHRENEENIVSFSSIYGNAEAVWNGNKTEIGVKYKVEIEASDCVWGEDVVLFEGQKFMLGMEDGEFYLIGRVESIDDDGYTVIRIGASIVAICISYKPDIMDAFIKVKPKRVILNEYDVC